MDIKDRIIVALDVDTLDQAGELVQELAPYTGCFKVGFQLTTSVGTPQVVNFIHERGGEVFLDGKFADIPNTVGAAAKAAVALGVKMFNLHCLGGRAMMEAARRAVDEVAGATQPLILGVTLLTSLSFDDLVELGIEREVNYTDAEQLAAYQRQQVERLAVRHLAWLAQESGLDGVIVSPQEIGAVRRYCQPELLVVTPGVRPEWAAVGDQKRVMTPGDAIKAGANYLVVGRPITQPPPEIGSSVDAAKKIAEEIGRALLTSSHVNRWE